MISDCTTEARFTMSAERWEALKETFGGEIETGSYIHDVVLCYEWPNADDHQEWLNTAPVAEILDWALSIR